MLKLFNLHKENGHFDSHSSKLDTAGILGGPLELEQVVH